MAARYGFAGPRSLRRAKAPAGAELGASFAAEIFSPKQPLKPILGNVPLVKSFASGVMIFVTRI